MLGQIIDPSEFDRIEALSDRNLFNEEDWKVFHKFEEYEKFWKDLVADNSNMSMKDLAKTYEKRTVSLVTIVGAGDKLIEVLIDCAQHAREWSAAQTCPYLAWHWTKNPEKIAGFKIYMVPMMNPDGFVFSHDIDPSDEDHRMWRKNRQPVEDNTEEVGIDLNRNWEINYVPSSSDAVNPENSKQQTWAGKKPYESEEDKQFQKFVKDGEHGKIRYHLDIHGSTKDYWIFSYPPNIEGTIPKATEHVEKLKNVAKAMSDSISKDSKKTIYGNTPELLYDAPGTIGDTMVEADGIVCSFLMEIPGDMNFNPLPDIWPVHDIVKNAAKSVDAALGRVKKGDCNLSRNLHAYKRDKQVLSYVYNI